MQSLSRFRVAVLGLLFSMPVTAPPSHLHAQEGGLVDRVAAVVGDSVITLTQVEEQIFQLQYQGADIPTDEAGRRQLQREILQSMVDYQLLVQAALQDTTIVVDEQQIDEIVSEDIENRMRSMGGQAAFTRALSSAQWTLATYRDFLRVQARQTQLRDQYLAKHMRDLGTIVVEEAEMRSLFESQRDRIGERPPTVAFTQIVLVPSPSDSSRAAALAEANRIRELALAGESFEELARQHSIDPGSREQGGDLGWFRRGAMVPEFEEAAFSLLEGQISGPVKSPYGFHIIKVERRRPGEVRARHILIQAQVSEADQANVASLAETVRDRLQAGEDFVSLREEYGDSLAPDTLSYAFNDLRRLPPTFGEPLTQAQAGDILGPLPYETQGRTNYAVLKVEEIREGGAYTFEDLEDQIRQRLQQEKLVERLLTDIKKRIYVQIRL